MKFKVNAKMLYNKTKPLFSIVLSIKEGIVTIHAESESLKFYIQTDSAKGVLGFTPEELKKMDYHCSNEGKMTVNPTMLKRWLMNYGTEDEAIYIYKNKKAGGIILGSNRRSKRPLHLFDSNIEFSLGEAERSIKLKGDLLNEGLQKISSAGISNKIYITSSPKNVLVQTRNHNNFISYRIPIEQHAYKKECSVMINTVNMNLIKNFLSQIRKQEIILGMGNESNLMIYAENSPVVSFPCETMESLPPIYNREPKDYYYRLDSKLKEWELVNTMTRCSNDERVEVNVDYINGTVEYSVGDHDYARNPIDYTMNARYYDQEILSTVPRTFDCDPQCLQSMLSLGDEKTVVKMYFAPKNPNDYKTVLVEYPLRRSSECQMYHIFAVK